MKTDLSDVNETRKNLRVEIPPWGYRFMTISI